MLRVSEGASTREVWRGEVCDDVPRKSGVREAIVVVVWRPGLTWI